MMISHLNEEQKSYLVYKLDHNTSCGLLTAQRIANKEFGDLEIFEVFEKFGDRSKRSAKCLAKKVETFQADPEVKRVRNFITNINFHIMKEIHKENFNISQIFEIYKSLSNDSKSNSKLYGVIR